MTANLTAELLLAVAGRLAERRELPRELVCSGLLDRQAGDVVEGFAAAGLDEARRLTSGDWVAISFAAPP
jgi:ribosomal protein L11 methylase PrmA